MKITREAPELRALAAWTGHPLVVYLIFASLGCLGVVGVVRTDLGKVLEAHETIGASCRR